MQTVSFRALIESIGGMTRHDFAEETFQAISTDSRTVQNGEVFFALIGETLDGHAYAAGALQKGAAAVVASKPIDCADDRVILVPDTTVALLDFAAWYRSQFTPHTVAVTGSVGKTTTKEMIAAVLEAAGQTLKSEGNQNNQIGLPKTLLRLLPEHEYAVFEMGMSDLNEINVLSRAARPDVGVITNIGVSHLENLKTRENILRAKLEITEGMAEGAPLIVNIDNDLLCNVKCPRQRLMTYGLLNPDADVRALQIEQERTSTRFVIRWNGTDYPAVIPCIGEHNVLNAAAAFAVGVTFGMQPEQIIPALANYAPAGMRQKLVPFGGMMVIEDCYNASPDSMRAALSTLRRIAATGKRIAVLGDMLELGSMAVSAHKELGDLVAKSDVTVLLCYGLLTGLTVEQAKAAGMEQAYHFESKEALAAKLCELAAEGDAILCKGSRSMQMEDVLKILYQK